MAKLGLAAVLAYGLFDGVTYTSFFVLAFLGYEKSTGQNPAANLKALLGVSYSCLSYGSSTSEIYHRCYVRAIILFNPKKQQAAIIEFLVNLSRQDMHCLLLNFSVFSLRFLFERN